MNWNMDRDICLREDETGLRPSGSKTKVGSPAFPSLPHVNACDSYWIAMTGFSRKDVKSEGRISALQESPTK